MNLLEISPVIPVVAIHHPDHVVPLARALLDGGIGIIEITLRTEAALPAIDLVAHHVPEMTVGAGTVTRVADVAAVASAGAQFIVTPGLTPALLSAVQASHLPALPGITTMSEALTAREHGMTRMKFFPAEAAGGVETLRALAGPAPDIRFCATGGITASSASRYLREPNVGCVGGSWIAPPAVIAAGHMAEIRRRAAEAVTRLSR